METKKEIATFDFNLKVHLYLTEAGEYRAELEVPKGELALSGAELQKPLAGFLEAPPPPTPMSGRIGVCLYILGKVKELAGDDPGRLAEKLETNELSWRTMMQTAFHCAEKKFGTTYSSCQDKLCRQLGIHVNSWDQLLQQYLVEKDGSRIKDLLMKNVPNTPSREEDIRQINAFFN